MGERAADTARVVARAISCVLRDCAAHQGDLLFKEKEEPFRANVVAHLALMRPSLLRFRASSGCAPLQVEFPMSTYGKAFRSRADLAIMGDKSTSAHPYWSTREERHYVPDVHVEFKMNMLHSRRSWSVDPFHLEYQRLKRVYDLFARKGHHVSAILAWPSRWPTFENAHDFGATAGEVKRQDERYKNLQKLARRSRRWLTLMHTE